MKRKFKLIAIAVFLVSVFALISCADANDPVSTDSNGILRIEDNVPLPGAPNDMDVSENFIAVANGPSGVVLLNKNSFTLLDVFDYAACAEEEGSAAESMKNITDVSIVEGLNRIFTVQKEDTDQVGCYSWDDEGIHSEVTLTGNTQSISAIYAFANSPDYPVYGNTIDGTVTTKDIVIVMLRSDRYIRAYDDILLTSDDLQAASRAFTVSFRQSDFFFHEGFYFGAAGYAGVSAWNMWGYLEDTDNNEAFDFVTYVDTPGEADQVVFANNKLYVADVHKGLQVIDVTFTEDAPEMTLREDLAYQTSSFARCVSANEDHLVVGSRGGGIYYFELDGEGNPTFKGQLPKSEIGYVSEVYVDGDEVIVLSRELGIVKVSINK